MSILARCWEDIDRLWDEKRVSQSPRVHPCFPMRRLQKALKSLHSAGTEERRDRLDLARFFEKLNVLLDDLVLGDLVFRREPVIADYRLIGGPQDELNGM